jgi:hypothetical protein
VVVALGARTAIPDRVFAHVQGRAATHASGKDIRDPIPVERWTVTLHPTVVGTTDDTWG